MALDGFDRFRTSYSIWGFTLDVDDLLKEGQPRAAHEVWRRGDLNPLGGGALTAGLIMEVYSGSSEPALHEAVASFLTHEARLLAAARSPGISADHSGLTTFISVGSNEEIPVGIGLSSSALERVAGAGVSWAVTVFPPIWSATD